MNCPVAVTSGPERACLAQTLKERQNNESTGKNETLGEALQLLPRRQR